MHLVPDARPVAPRSIAAGGVAALGGALIVAGAWFPWFSLYAGLHPLRGITAINGRLLVIGGAAAAALGLALLVRDDRRLRTMLGCLGGGLLGFATWILVGVPATYRAMQQNPMLVARIGPGLFVVLLGALLVVAAPFVRRPGGAVRLPTGEIART